MRNLETFEETAPQIEIINKVRLSKIETAEDLSNVNFLINSFADDKFLERTFKNIKDFLVANHQQYRLYHIDNPTCTR